MSFIDPTNPVVNLCQQGTRAEFEHRPTDARQFYQQAWEAVTNDYEASIAAHYLARVQARPEDRLHWNQEALRRALAVSDQAQVAAFYGSLYLCLGQSYEALDDPAQARRCYDLAAGFGAQHVQDQDGL